MLSDDQVVPDWRPSWRESTAKTEDRDDRERVPVAPAIVAELYAGLYDAE
jgi:hypothetical protein